MRQCSVSECQPRQQGQYTEAIDKLEASLARHTQRQPVIELLECHLQVGCIEEGRKLRIAHQQLLGLPAGPSARGVAMVLLGVFGLLLAGL